MFLVNEDDINQGTGGMTADNMTSWEKDTSEKLLASISSVNQSVENANKNYTNTNKGNLKNKQSKELKILIEQM